MFEVQRRFLRSHDGAAAIEYALIGFGVAIVVVVAVGGLGVNLAACYGQIAAAFP